MLAREQCLMLAVLKQAVADLQSPSCTVRWRAHGWFLGSAGKRNHIFAFSRICREFARDPAATRTRIFATVPNGGETLH